MKILLTLSLVFYTVNGFSFSNIFSQNEEIKPFSICTGVDDGTRLPDETNCQRFTLCDNGIGLSLSCRTSEPHFYRCNSTCVKDPSVCQIKECPGEVTTTSTAASTTTTTAASTTTTTTKTTTRFIPPTAPISLCNPACNSANFPTDSICDCLEQWVCRADRTCGCDIEIKCPMDRETCKNADTSVGCGCEEACDCTGEAGAEKCYCNSDVTCPFPDTGTNCEDKCGCRRNCDCTSGTCFCINDGRQCPFDPAECYLRCGCLTNCDRVSFTPKAVCFDTCRCQDAYLCPFDQSQCISKCGCTERCVTTGTLTRCNPDVVCTRNAHDFFSNFWHEN